MESSENFDDPGPGVDRFLSVITPKMGDPTYSVLRAHLLFEELLRDFVAKQFVHPTALQGARLSFAQLLAIGRAAAVTLEPNDWRWAALDKLNRLRNLLAHNIEAEVVTDKVQALISFAVREVGIPLPEPQAKMPADAPVPVSGPRYTALDMVLCGLHTQLAALLGFDAKVRLATEVLRDSLVAKNLGKKLPPRYD
ncbi:hypothetical protein [Rubrivivax gelatinosus]|uniref:hypothetical protein n=1 Tax=Rubrivivax gelatinosus TaxID=28068 RepID=UPI001908341D|nr:hypothetical protein [Rubrivivax gelatinosus]